MNIGIIGTGKIAHMMAKTLALMHEGLYAVASRSRERAERFARETGALHVYGSYEELAEDGNVDLVYIATPHSEHEANALLCLERGRNILVEKSFAANASQARNIFSHAEKRGLLATEAIWTRYMPSRAIIDGLMEEIGEPRLLTANLFYDIDEVDRITNPSLAGGALLDVGVYPLNFMSMNFGNDYVSVDSTVVLTESGVDRQNSMVYRYGDGRLACLESGTQFLSDRRGIIYGTKGTIEIENINNPERIRLLDQNRSLLKEVPIPPQYTGYEYEVRSAEKAIREGRIECPEMPHSETIRIMEMMDSLRASWGIRFPFE